MASKLSNLFISASTVLSHRIEDLRNAEANLIQFAVRYGGSGSSAQINIFDTKIARDCVPLEKACKCQLFKDKKEEDHYIMHGVKVTSSSSTKSSEERPPLVLLHGYANGALYFYRNLLGLQKHFGTVYSLDLLGWGLSSRPEFQTTESTVEQAEDVFVESLEAWRAAHNIDRMVLGGHSMGGYLGVAYCERYPDRVEKLVLLSPVGVPEQPKDNQSDRISPNLDYKRRFLFGSLRFLWRNNVTPGGFLRSLTEKRGRQMVRGYLDRRIPALNTAEDEKVHLSEYLYTNSILPGSGEYALNRLLVPMAYARKPIMARIPKLAVKKVTFVYGAQDWMDPSGGLAVQARCTTSSSSTPEVEVYSVRDAGHLLLLDNWEEFNAAVILADGGKPPAASPLPVKLKATQ